MWRLLKWTFFGAMALAMVVPLLLIIGYLVAKAWPLLSWEFLTSNPTSGMRKGGVWSALLGTIYLATDLSQGDPAPDATEDLRLRWVAFDEALAMIDDGRITDLLTIAALERVGRLRR